MLFRSPQTRILWRALRRLHVPTLFFVNKIDRRGAGYERLLADIAGRLTPAIIPRFKVIQPCFVWCVPESSQGR